jgi:hypothetical protein
MHGSDGQLLEYTQYLPDSLHSLDHGKHRGKHRLSQHVFEVTTAVRNNRGGTHVLYHQGRIQSGRFRWNRAIHRWELAHKVVLQPETEKPASGS